MIFFRELIIKLILIYILKHQLDHLEVKMYQS